MPYDAFDGERPLEAGMMVSVETTVLHPRRGFIKLEDTVAVTQDGFEIYGEGGRGWNRGGTAALGLQADQPPNRNARRSATRSAVSVLQGRVVHLAGADAHGAIDGGDEDLAVADLAGVGHAPDRLDGAIGQGRRDDGLESSPSARS